MTDSDSLPTDTPEQVLKARAVALRRAAERYWEDHRRALGSAEAYRLKAIDLDRQADEFEAVSGDLNKKMAMGRLS